MLSAEFPERFGANRASTQAGHRIYPANVPGQTPRQDSGQAKAAGSVARPATGFLNQSIDEIARLYIASPFSW